MLGLGNTYGLLGTVPSVLGFDPAALAIFAAFTTPPTAARQIVINNTVVALKSAGVWTLFDFLHVYAAADSQAATINWVNPATFTAVPTSAPTFTADRGFTGNGTTSYVDTGFTPSTQAVKLGQNSAHISSWSLTAGVAASSTQRLIGNSATTTSRTVLIPVFTGNVIDILVNGTTGDTTANTSSDGMFIGNRDGASTTETYRNGAALGAGGTGSSSGLPSTSITIDRDTTNFATLQAAMASAGAALTPTQATAFYNALFNNYMHIIGAA